MGATRRVRYRLHRSSWSWELTTRFAGSICSRQRTAWRCAA